MSTTARSRSGDPPASDDTPIETPRTPREAREGELVRSSVRAGINGIAWKLGLAVAGPLTAAFVAGGVFMYREIGEVERDVAAAERRVDRHVNGSHKSAADRAVKVTGEIESIKTDLSGHKKSADEKWERVQDRLDSIDAKVGAIERRTRWREVDRE